MNTRNPVNGYPAEPIVRKGELPDPFAMPGGARVATREAWRERSLAWRDMIADLEYGGMPPAPDAVEIETLSHSSIHHWPGEPRFWSYRVHCHGGEKPFSFCVQILFPDKPEPVPAIATGDECWWDVSDEVARHVLDRGCALALFNRTEIAEDLGYGGVPDTNKRKGGLYDVYPGRTFGALSAWAWGYHRCVDLLRELPFIDNERIAVTGHSRGGKTTLLAGATDERITLVNDNASCAAGSAAFRYVGNGGETLNIANVFPSWFGPKLKSYVNREEDLPFDQHCLLATIAPRPLLLTYALDDGWSNPEGMVQCAWAAGEVYRFLGASDNVAFHLRPGGHSHGIDDWKVLLDFARCKWFGQKSGVAYNTHPDAHLQPAFSWKAPCV